MERKPAVVLIHGILMSTWYLARIKQQLSGHFDCYAFSYPSHRDSIDYAAERLHRFLIQNNISRCHFVVHSMGGLVLSQFFKMYDFPKTTTVALGSPLAGSSVARNLAKNPMGRAILGAQKEGLLQQGITSWPEPHELACITGCKPVGIGRVFKLSDGKNSDGTVSFKETQIHRIKEQISIPTTHTMMVYDKRVLKQIENYLLHGHFDYDGENA